MNILLAIISFVLLRFYQLKMRPFLFWSKTKLGNSTYVPWPKVFSGKIISKKKLIDLTLRYNGRIPECKTCFMAVLNDRQGLHKDTIIDPNVEDNTIIVLTDVKIVFVCIKCKTQLEEYKIQ